MQADTKPRRILYLDDEPGPLAAAFKAVLEPHGYAVLTASSNEEALSILRTETVDLLIQDLARPGLNGIEFYGLLQGDERLRNLPVVICSGSGELRQEFLEHYPDAAGVFGKPVDLELLLEVVRKIVHPIGGESGNETRTS